MASIEDLQEGDIAFGPIRGVTGAFVGAAQLALAVAEPGVVWKSGVRQWFRKRHCGIVSTASPEGLHQPKMVQAMPGGAEEIELSCATHWTSDWVFIRPTYLPPGQASVVAAAARGYVQTPYDFATYAAIPAYRAGLDGPAIRDIISDTSTMMCSRLVDASLAVAGYHLFDDGRLPGNVTPSEVYRRLLQLPHKLILPVPM